MRASPTNTDQLTSRSKSSSVDHANSFDLALRLDWKGVSNLNKLIKQIETFQTMTGIPEWGQNEKLETKSKSECFHATFFKIFVNVLMKPFDSKMTVRFLLREAKR